MEYSVKGAESAYCGIFNEVLAAFVCCVQTELVWRKGADTMDILEHYVLGDSTGKRVSWEGFKSSLRSIFMRNI